MKIESWELLQFFDEHIQLPDMSYGLLAFSLETPQIKIEFHLNKVACSAQFIIDAGVKQLIKLKDIEEIKSDFNDFFVAQSNGGAIKFTKEKELSLFIDI